MGETAVWVVGGAAVITSILSAVAGLGGGVILLAVIAQFFAPTVAIPVHGGIQLVSNSSRAISLRRAISWDVVGWTILPMLPASVLGSLVATSLPATTARVIMGVFLLVLAWRPGWLRFSPERGIGRRGLLGVGAASGFLNTTFGASGPMTSPFLRAATAGHTAFVATAAATQIAAHASKLAAYRLTGFSLLDHVDVVIAGSVGAIVGTLIGTRLLGNINEELLGRLFQIVITVLALRLISQGLR